MANAPKRHLYMPYIIMLGVYGLFVIFAFLLDTPTEIINGLWRILTARSILISDYIQLGGIGATLINAVVVGCFAIWLMVHNAIKPNGAIIMAIWLSTGFAFFGKNVFNMIPLIVGVWLFSKWENKPFMNYSLASLLCATLSPIVSEITFMNAFPKPIGLVVGILLGVFIGLIFSAVSAATVNVHGGFCLYNMGFSGGLIATFVVCIMRSIGVEIETEVIWNVGNNGVLAVLLYLTSMFLVVCGLFLGDDPLDFSKLKRICNHPGRLITDFYLLYDYSAYLNMGLLCALGTTVILVLGGDLNGATIGGIFTITGFGCFGKNLKNVPPLLIGAVLCTYFNYWDPRSPSNMLAILFATGLAPISGQYGWKWGILAGFLHVNMASFVGQLNSGLNLYNNGFAGGFVAMFLVPLIEAFGKGVASER